MKDYKVTGVKIDSSGKDTYHLVKVIKAIEGHRVEIDIRGEGFGVYDEGKKKRWVINWGAYGSQGIDFTNEFTGLLSIALDIAMDLTKEIKQID